MTCIPTEMTFFARFEADILAKKKTITIRDESESHYQVGSTVDVSTLEEGRWFCKLHIDAVTPVTFSELTDFHAEQENMTLPELKAVINEIYPNVESLYVVTYHLVEE
ncbi:RNA-binding domain protein [Photobacterium aphoticum]|uniref:N(4)-acetylcytidine amidohydrolase n=1 Tax=Photobacterium aphoticum TaxID=754436 RepID=A0A090RLB5_9GAMM|nr:RNA-binding domain protein [Photobacterium aphoticum]